MAPQRSLADSPDSLAGRVSVITGSTSGIGLEVAKVLRSSGATVVLNARNAENLAAAVDDVTAVEPASSGAVVRGIQADVTRPADIDRLVDEVRREFHRADILVNNAGRTMVADTLNLAVNDWNEMVSLNLTAPFLCSQAFGRLMVEQRSGVIVNIGSIFGVVGSARRAAYCSTKHALIGLTKVLASEWGQHGVRVCIVNAGYVSTPMVQRMLDAGTLSKDRLANRIPAGRLAASREVANAVRFLVSDRAEYANGAQINLDGGWLAHSGW